MKPIQSITENLRETYGSVEIDEYVEGLPYELMHKLLGEIDRLGNMVMSTRAEVNALTPHSQYAPYPDLASDIWDMAWHDHPAVRIYEEIYGVIE